VGFPGPCLPPKASATAGSGPARDNVRDTVADTVAPV
jgi:hypothetical protein